ncbi:ParA family protein [Longimicrobium sp.]|jgi:chromosome partitioning protein|uniref:ParA family protein n=1 Tax=Longimicrobium sp. TaxID=2029185 RepID=UPI002F93109C
MLVVSVINYKGGVGKTTVTSNLATELAFRGQRVLAIDLDPQASLTFSLVRPEYWEAELSAGKTIKAWFDSFSSGQALSLEDLVISPTAANARIPDGSLDLIPSHLGLIKR